MAQVIILTDSILHGEIGSPRYMGPYAIASALRKDQISTVVIDHFTKIDDIFGYLSEVISSDTHVVAISSTFLAPFRSIKKARQNRSEGVQSFYRGELWFESGDELVVWLKKLKLLLRDVNPDAKLVLGGVKSQFALWRHQYYSEFDYICIGAADRSFPKFVRQVMNKEKIETKTLLDQVHLIDNTIDLVDKSCPETVWSSWDAVQRSESLPIEISRGCVFNCKFCHYDKKESFKKPLDILYQELVRNYDKFGVSVYSFCDDCFNDHPKKVEAYCEMFKKLPFKIEWTAYARVDVAVKFPHTVDLMVEAGARGLYWGLESFDPEVARRAGKGTPTHLVKDFLLEFKNRYRGRCLSEGSFIVGLPGEQKESNYQTLNWIMENDPLDLATFGPLGLMPYVPSLDKVLFDYADYSKNPEKYGFKEVRFQPQYWAHEQMNSIEANEIATDMTRKWREGIPKGFLKTIWLYPHARTLGFDHESAMSAYSSPEKSSYYAQEMELRFENYVKAYHSELKRRICKGTALDDL